MGFLIMRTRIIIHYYNGMTWTGDWDESEDFKSLCKDPISSLQIQEEGGKNHTLSIKRKQVRAFWQRDYRIEGKLQNRSILRKLSKNVWVDLNLDCITGRRTIMIIKENIDA
jgi:hypothetical protein